MAREVRKPLIVFTPKSLLRAKQSRSPVAELESGSFQEVLDDPRIGDADRDAVTRVVFSSGKVAVDALDQRDASSTPVAVVRVEQLYPWPFDDVAKALEGYPNAREIVWLQEEPENMGPWNAVKGRLYEAHGDRYTIKRVSRAESGSPAVGSLAVHKQEQAALIEAALTPDA